MMEDAPSSSARRKGRPALSRTGKWAAGLAAASIVATISAVYTQCNLAIQATHEERRERLHRLQASGHAMDQSFRALNDSIVDQAQVPEAREAMRQAIAKHSSDLRDCADIIGTPGMSDYSEGLAALRREVDGVTVPEDSIEMAQLSVDLIVLRDSLITSAKR